MLDNEWWVEEEGPFDETGWDYVGHYWTTDSDHGRHVLDIYKECVDKGYKEMMSVHIDYDDVNVFARK